jgi:hypothetical protein
MSNYYHTTNNKTNIIFNDYIVVAYNHGLLNLWTIKTVNPTSISSQLSIPLLNKETEYMLNNIELRMTMNNNGWIIAPFDERMFFARIKHSGTDVSLDYLSPIPGNSFINPEKARIHSCDSVTLVDSEKDEPGWNVYIPDKYYAWKKYKLPDNIGLWDISFSPDKTMWLTGCFTKTDSNGNSKSNQFLYSKIPDEKNFIKEDVIFDKITKYKLSYHELNTYFAHINAESEPFLATSSDYLFSTPSYEMLYYRKKSLWSVKILKNKSIIDIHRLSNGDSRIITYEGNLYILDKKYNFYKTGSIKKLYKELIPESYKVRNSNIDLIIYSADSWNNELAIIVSASDSINTISNAFCISHDDGKNWDIILKTEPYKDEPELLRISAIK